MKFTNPIIVGQLEDRADEQGRGSVWRACLAIHRCCENEALASLITELGYGYCVGRDTIKHLQQICDDHFGDSKDELREAIQALKNAIEMAPKEINVQSGQAKPYTVDKREELWLRLNRLVK